MRLLQLPDDDGASVLLEEIFSSEPAQPSHDEAHSVVLYGAGELGRLAFDFLEYVGIKVEFAIDRAARDGDLIRGSIPVFRPGQSPRLDNHLILVSTVSVPYSEISDLLKKHGLKRVLPFYDYALQFTDKHPLNNGWFSGPLSAEDKKNISEVMAGFIDAQSKAAYLQFLAWRVLREDWIFDEIVVVRSNRFFIDQVVNRLTKNENFLDIGAYDGRVFLQFLKLTSEKFNSALLIEPDEENFLSLQFTIKQLPKNIVSKTILRKCALSEKSGKFNFAQGFGMASRLRENNQDMTDVIRLDDLDFPTTFLKMHVEGGEHRTLKGGISYLKKNRPILAITVYHNRDGLWRIQRLLQTSLLDFNFIFRMHSWSGTGAVIYGIPKESKIQ
jgi:FkbM family methyltransferase